MTLPDSAYARLLALRTGLRLFERWSAQQAQAANLTPAQHQLLLAIRGHHDPAGPTIGEVADYLLLKHHSTVGLVDRAEAAGLVSRSRDDNDHRVVRLHLTPDAERRLEGLSALHLEELDRLQLELPAAWDGLAPVQRQHGFPGEPELSPAREAITVSIGRVYGDSPASGRLRVLVDRLWPRGITKQSPPFEEWMREVAPTSELRRWYGHRPERFAEFSRRYRDELDSEDHKRALEELASRAATEEIELVTATRDLEHSAAAVLQEVLAGR